MLAHGVNGDYSFAGCEDYVEVIAKARRRKRRSNPTANRDAIPSQKLSCCLKLFSWIAARNRLRCTAGLLQPLRTAKQVPRSARNGVWHRKKG